jgi:hypothetical protein
VSALAATGINLATAAPAQAAAAPTTLQGVIELGRTYKPLTFAQMRGMTEGPWATWNGGPWCAWYLSWITRGLGYFPGTGGFNANADAWEWLPHFETPQVGDFARINDGEDGPYHIGLVTQVSPTIQILDGNRWGGDAPKPHDRTTTIVQEYGKYSPGTYRRPTYPGGLGNTPQPTTSEEEEMLYMLYALDTMATPQFRWAVTGPGYWTVVTSQSAADKLTAKLGAAAPVLWAEWDLAYSAAVSSGFVPKAGQTSRSVS